MKTVFFLLLAVNLVVAGIITMRELTPNPDALLAGQQIHADQIVTIPPRPRPPPESAAPATPAPDKTAVCMEWASFGAVELTKAEKSLEGLRLGARLQRTEVSVPSRFWVFVPPMRNKVQMEKKMAELKALGVAELYPMLEPGPDLHAISLGIFRSEDGARKYLATLRDIGVRSAKVGEREQRITQTSLVIRNPSDQESTRLVELKTEYAGSDIRVVKCPPT
ncbi:MAG: hypothetical protein ACKVP2_04495 [Burkholderiales bacterium]